MPRLAILCLLLFASNGAALAQSAGQFHANDKGEYGWTENSKSKLRSTTWFAKNPNDSATYRQIAAVIYDGKPGEVLYLDRTAKRVVGRLDLESEKFALLPASDQRLRQPIDKFKFPTASELPRVEEMFDLVKREIVRAGYEGMLGAGVVITGGTSLLEGMPDAAERGLNLPARRGMPTGIGGLRDIVSNPMHATGVGLLLHARQHADNLEAAGIRHGKGLGKVFDRMRSWMFEFF